MLKKNFLFSALALFALWAGWLIAYYAIGNEYLLPSFGQTVRSAFALLGKGEFWRAFGATFLRTAVAFVCSFACGGTLALVSRLYPAVRAFFAPLVSVLRTLPTMAVILALLLWTSPAAAPVIVAALVLFPALYAACLSAFDGAGEAFCDLTEAFGVCAKRKILRMYLPLAAPSVLGQAGAICSMGLKVIVSGEVLSSTYRSLGGMMHEAQNVLDMPQLLALTLVTVCIGFALEGLFALAAKPLLRWKA